MRISYLSADIHNATVVAEFFGNFLRQRLVAYSVMEQNLVWMQHGQLQDGLVVRMAVEVQENFQLRDLFQHRSSRHMMKEKYLELEKHRCLTFKVSILQMHTSRPRFSTTETITAPR
jgi:hypothetical protein